MGCPNNHRTSYQPLRSRRGWTRRRKVLERLVTDPSAREVLSAQRATLSERVPVELSLDRFAITDLAMAVATRPTTGGWVHPMAFPVLHPDDHCPCLRCTKTRAIHGSPLARGPLVGLNARTLPGGGARPPQLSAESCTGLVVTTWTTVGAFTTTTHSPITANGSPC